uniref:Ephrin RBD domain-containing protein n=1 Tax=Caenorhabditis japonica TaxID=281687 RepID=A0A8R1I2L6_CAEJA
MHPVPISETILLLLLLFFCTPTSTKRLPQIYWNSTNPLVERYAAIGDTLDIVCPFFEENTEQLTEESIIYRVSEEEYENCERRSNSKELGRCTQPHQQEKLKVAFRLMSPNPSGLDYRPGVTYYFISTSTGSRKGLYNEQGGLCASHNLKMVIHITDKNGDIGPHHHRHHHKKTTTTTTESPVKPEPLLTSSQIATLDTSSEKLWEQFYEKVLPIENTWPEISTRGERVTLYQGSKKDEYEQVPAEVVDFEIHEIGDVESLYSSSGSSRSQGLFMLLLPATLLWLL